MHSMLNIYPRCKLCFYSYQKFQPTEFSDTGCPSTGVSEGAGVAKVICRALKS